MTFVDSIKRSVGRGPRADTAEPSSDVAPSVAGSASAVAAAPAVTAPAVEIAPTDPLFAYLQAASGVVDAERLELDSPALTELRAAHIRAIVPLVAQGELIGALYLGPRLSDQEYSADDRKLLTTLAAQAAPAIRVAQLVREQAVEIEARERLEQEMRVATLIQQQFLPRELPQLPDWQVAAYYGPARAVGGDFYDFIPLPDGRIGIVVGDVTDKGVPAALIMARTQSVLRGEAPRLLSPAKVLERANEILLPEMPARMFVTCLYMVLEPATGRVDFANAGHNLPYVRTADGVIELRATGMPLGLLAGMDYPEHEAVLAPGESVLLYSDGLVEAHGPAGDMFGFPKLRGLMDTERPGSELLDHLLDELHGFVGEGWDQEDDITLVALQRTGGYGLAEVAPTASVDGATATAAETPAGQVLLQVTLPGEQGNERQAMDLVAEAVAGVGLRAGTAGAAQDRRQRGDDERDRVRQQVRSHHPGRDRGDGRRRRPDRAHHRPGPEWRDHGLRGARPRGEAGRRAEAARLGPLPHQAHGRRDGGRDPRERADRRPDAPSRRSRRCQRSR